MKPIIVIFHTKLWTRERIQQFRESFKNMNKEYEIILVENSNFDHAQMFCMAPDAKPDELQNIIHQIQSTNFPLKEDAEKG